jgi:hypothetical protein
MSRRSLVASISVVVLSACGRVDFDFPGALDASDAISSPDAGAEASAPSATVTPLSCTGNDTVCGSSCADLLNNPQNCGECRRRCEGATPLCDRGTCVGTCGEGLVNCGGACVDLATDARHCSACDAACAGEDVCALGQCSCPAGKERCGPSCVDLASDPLNCGACGVRCGGKEPVCNVGVCRASCTGGLTACAGACIDLRIDPEHCGNCTVVCANGACNKGMCVCASGQILCGRRCVDTNKDGSNCGACGRGCPAANVCSGGECK